MKLVHIFVVFHKKIFDECYKELTQEELDSYFTFVAVNPTIQKEYNTSKYNIIREWELPVYDPGLQEKGYRENSVLYHAWANKLHEPYDYIGFFQYDMVFQRDTLKNVISEISKANDLIYFPLQTYTFKYIYETMGYEHNTVKFIIEDYTKYFNQEFSYKADYPLWNTFILPKEFYSDKMMPWIYQLYEKTWPWCNQAPNQTHFTHVAGVYERVSAMIVGEACMRPVLLNIEHDHKYKALSY